MEQVTREIAAAIHEHLYEVQVKLAGNEDWYAAWRSYFSALGTGRDASPPGEIDASRQDEWQEYLAAIKDRVDARRAFDASRDEACRRVSKMAQVAIIGFNGKFIEERDLRVHPIEDNYIVEGCFEYCSFHKGGRIRRYWYAARDRRDEIDSPWMEISREMYWEAKGKGSQPLYMGYNGQGARPGFSDIPPFF